MQNKFRKYFLIAMPMLLAMLLWSCSSSDEPSPDAGQFPDIEVPAIYDIIKGEARVVTLKIKSGKVETTDIVSVQTEGSGTSIPCAVSDITAESFSFAFPESLSDGTYRLFFRRNGETKSLGQIKIAIVDKPFDPQPGTTVYGTISTDEGPLADVLVSDGTIFAKTNAEGRYEMQSEKPLGYVFVITPSGYEPAQNGVFPVISQAMRYDKDIPEVANFTFRKVDQSKYTVLFLGDMHLADRTGDLAQFRDFTSDLNSYCSTHTGERIYGITLGDMSWDLYWYSRNYSLSNYVQTINTQVAATGNDIMIYHTIGNHDNDMKAKNNFDAKTAFRSVIAPNYYSYNIGGHHYIALDNIDCSAYDGTESRNYSEQLLADQVAWLKKDLSYVDKSTPVILIMHAPMYGPNGASQFRLHMGNASEVLGIFDGYSLNIVTGHTHKNYNVAPSHTCVGGKDIREHNVAAVCGSWWWSGHLTPGVHLAPDGAPGGYAIWNFNGKDVKWIYKPTGKSTDVQFRAYDLNEVKFSDADVPQLDKSTSAYKDWTKYAKAYPGTKNDKVLINIWNYNPSWKITVTEEGGRTLTPTPVTAYDPLHIAAMSVKRFNSSSIKSAPSFVTQNYPHFFQVTCDNSDVDLTIRVEDEFGNVWTENMERPRAFSIEAYK